MLVSSGPDSRLRTHAAVFGSFDDFLLMLTLDKEGMRPSRNGYTHFYFTMVTKVMQCFREN